MILVTRQRSSVTKIINSVYQHAELLCFRNFRLHTCPVKRATELSDEEVTKILRANEFSRAFDGKESYVKSYDSNQLPSNSPIEDTRSEAKCLLSRGFLAGVFDGHAGPACAQVVAKRLFDYIYAALLTEDDLRQYSLSLEGKANALSTLEKFNETYELLPQLRTLYQRSHRKYVKNLLHRAENPLRPETALETAIVSLDDDISEEALNNADTKIATQTLQVAMSGSVGCVAYIDGPHLYVANVGDCRAVLGFRNTENVWKAKNLTRDHSSRNMDEVKRIQNEHPANEHVFLDGRLLGYLAPLRAFGDFSYKWSRDVLGKIVAAKLPAELAKYAGMIEWQCRHYPTPPYLTAKPEIAHHRLAACDQFLILATDGLWDELSSIEAVRLVGEHLRGKVLLSPFEVPEPDMKLKDILKILLQRKECFEIKPADKNAATHLLRNALGRAANEILTIGPGSSRYFRDDITITVVFFDTECITQAPE